MVGSPAEEPIKRLGPGDFSTPAPSLAAGGEVEWMMMPAIDFLHQTARAEPSAQVKV
jgi:hypothetical protein